MKFLLLLLLLGSSLLAQNAIYNNFSPTVKGVTIGTVHCYAWFHASAPSPWDVEVACYSAGVVNYISVGKAGQTVQDTFNYSGGNIGWLFTSLAGVITYQFTGQGPSDSSAIFVTGSI